MFYILRMFFSFFPSFMHQNLARVVLNFSIWSHGAFKLQSYVIPARDGVALSPPWPSTRGCMVGFPGVQASAYSSFTEHQTCTAAGAWQSLCRLCKVQVSSATSPPCPGGVKTYRGAFPSVRKVLWLWFLTRSHLHRVVRHVQWTLASQILRWVCALW